jgi:AhpC/TSA family
MTRWTIRTFVLALIPLAMPAITLAAKVGEPAPAFSAKDTYGRTYRLADLRDRWVVLEWHNQGCPYVRKHYDSGNMQKLQKTWTEKGVIWLTVISSAPGMQGHVTTEEANSYVKTSKASPTAILLDPSGELGHLYEALTTPHMYVINPRGVLIYNGAIDNTPSTELSDVADAVNYVSAALAEAMAGKPVAIPTSRPYGCSVKYAGPGK